MLGADAAGIAAAAQILRAGGLVAFPTETVFGLGADATSNEAVAKIYAAKGRPSFNPLIAHVPDRAAAEKQGLFSAQAAKLAEAFWPGPLTLVLPLAPTATVCDLARAGLDSVALRVPSHPVARRLLAAAGLPLAAPSANPSGRVSAVTAAHVREDFDGRIDAIIDGAVAVGLESTIISCLGEKPALLRPGGVPRAAIEAVLGEKLAEAESGAAIRAPGMLAAHYAPRARLRLNAKRLEPGEAGLDFGAHFPAATNALDLSPKGDLVEAAAHLFGYLRQLDAHYSAIAVAPIPEEGLGEAINDRLRRAAVR
ncbi:MAG: L-threonylcarbamoyladenylate synthase [Methylovirgula sp.]|nr:L-threonylcarbamoyladenylate synthase [Methylovirgula sp.]